MEYWLQGIYTVLELKVLLAISCGVILGTIIGAIPGLTATMGIGLLIPFTFKMPPVMGIGLLLGVYVGGVSGGSFSSILLGIPGTPSNFVTLFDGYPMAKKGRAGKALAAAVFSSFVGGIFSAIVLSTLAPPLARVALGFGPPEYFAFALMGLCLVAGISGDSLVKGLIAAGLGILISCVGLDPMTGFPRYTFDNVNLLRGIPLLPALVGLFAIPPLLKEINYYKITKPSFNEKIRGIVLKFSDLKKMGWTLLTSSFIGTAIGIIPGTGAAIAGFLSYDAAKAISKRPEKFGEGIIEGVTASECCNNATVGGALVPLMVLGIPGDAVTAVLLGGLMIQGLIPGPLLFQENPVIVYGLFAAFFAANIIMLFFQAFTLRYYALLTKVPTRLLVPLLLFLCCLGSFSISNSMFDIWIMLGLGVIGHILGNFGVPIAPIVLGIVLGPILEANLRRSMMLLNGDYIKFFERPITVSCLLLGIVFLIIILKRRPKKHAGDSK